MLLVQAQPAHLLLRARAALHCQPQFCISAHVKLW